METTVSQAVSCFSLWSELYPPPIASLSTLYIYYLTLSLGCSVMFVVAGF